MDKEKLLSQTHWLMLAEKRLEERWNDEEKVEKELNHLYRAYAKDTKTLLSDFYNQYAIDNHLKYSDVIKKLDNLSLQDYRITMNRLVTKYQNSENSELIGALVALSNPSSLTRIEAFNNTLAGLMLEMEYEEVQILNQTLGEQYVESYYKSLYDVQHSFGVGNAFKPLDSETIKTVITYPWSGASFSDRNWHNKQKLIKVLREEITAGLVRGDSHQKMATAVAKRMDSSYKSALALVRTETSRVISEATFNSYVKSGSLEQYVLIATLDNRTSTICQNLDKKHYYFHEKKEGINFPPFHTSCRTAISPYVDEKTISNMMRRARDPKTGQTYLVLASMNYAEWYEKYVK